MHLLSVELRIQQYWIPSFSSLFEFIFLRDTWICLCGFWFFRLNCMLLLFFRFSPVQVTFFFCSVRMVLIAGQTGIILLWPQAKSASIINPASLFRRLFLVHMYSCVSLTHYLVTILLQPSQIIGSRWTHDSESYAQGRWASEGLLSLV